MSEPTITYPLSVLDELQTPDDDATVDALMARRADGEKVEPVVPRSALAAAEAINIVFDGPPGPVCGRFVEVEDDEGRSIIAGRWSQRADGLWALRVLLSASAEKTEEALADIAAQLHAHHDSVLTGEHGLAAATYRQAMMADEADGRARDAEAKVAHLTTRLSDLAMQLGRVEGELEAMKMMKREG